jgi:hypothetical protein
VLQGLDAQFFMKALSQLRPDARNILKEILWFGRAAQTIEIGPLARRRHFGDRGGDAAPDMRDAIQRFDPAFPQYFGNILGLCGHAIRRSPIGCNTKGIVVLRSQQIGGLVQPLGDERVHRLGADGTFA